MLVCAILLPPLNLFIQFVIPVVQQINSIVCSWVHTFFEVVKEVVNKICGWLPWPFNEVCRWVSSLITVYFVDSIVGASGCAIPGDSWCRVDAEANTNPTIMAHEVGHLLNLWAHSDDPQNLMYGEASLTDGSGQIISTNLTKHQCCTMHTSPFVTY